MNPSLAAVMFDVSFEDDVLRFVMQPNPMPFSQGTDVALYELTRQ